MDNTLCLKLPLPWIEAFWPSQVMVWFLFPSKWILSRDFRPSQTGSWAIPTVHAPASAHQGTSLLGQSPFSVSDCMSLPFSPQYFLFWGVQWGERSYFRSLGIMLFKNRRLWSDSLCSLPFGNGCLMTFALVIKVPPSKKRKSSYSSPFYFSYCVVNIFQCEMKT